MIASKQIYYGVATTKNVMIKLYEYLYDIYFVIFTIFTNKIFKY